jgi:type I restriction-modification system DNA methylase subunit
MPSNFEQAFDRVKQLASDFQANAQFYLSPAYQEAEARRDFVDKFLMALGWDVNHDSQKNPYEQEVKVERREQGVSQRRADYAFYAAPNFGDVQFIMEAKKPRGDIATPDNYFQVIGYGWNSRTPIAALFDFAQFEIVDSRFKPDMGTALQRNLKKFHFSQYTDAEKFAEIYWLFSREAVAAGSLEKYAKTLPKKRGEGQRGFPKGGERSFDDSFLEDLDAYRDALAHNFKNHNPNLDGETLTEVTQRTLDRLVFMRFLEDKLIEPQSLIPKFGERGSAWDDFIAASRRLDGIYNGIVFKKHQRLDSPDFKIDASQFADICKRLSHVNSIYNFNFIPIHILGSIYERFLGKVIVATGKRARVEEKPEVRKAGGVYYTPEYITRYIVENTVGKLIEGKTPAQIAEMRFADIACGSGSFLLAMFDLLIRHHTKYYNENPGKAKKGETVERDDGLHLSLQKKREVLLNNIYGVDIDAQAVEVAQLSLYLKLLQDETPGSARGYQMEFHETLLPSLNKNIVCGNSLIGRDIVVADFFESGDSERKLNPMDFEDAFPQIMKSGGFDAIVGNPPYIFTRNEGLTTNEKLYFYKNYHYQSAQLNTFGLFLEKAQRICRKGACVGYITPSNWLTIDSFAPLRRFLLTETSGLTVINILDRVFAAADVDTAIVLLQKGDPTKVTLAEMRDKKISFSREAPIRTFKPAKFILQIALLKDKRAQRIMARIESVSVPLGEACAVSTGLKVYQTGKGKPPQSDKEKRNRVFHASKKVNRSYGRYLDGVDVCRYYLSWSGEWLSYGDWLAEPRKSVPFSGERILVRQIPSSSPYLVHGVWTDQPFYNDINSMVIFAPKDGLSLHYLLALVNSRLISSWFQKTYDKLQRRIFPQFKVNELASFPIRRIDFDNPAEKARHEKVVSLVEQMLSAKKQYAAAQSDKDKNFYEGKCAALDRQIDALVYDLYGLADAEIKVVEAA